MATWKPGKVKFNVEPVNEAAADREARLREYRACVERALRDAGISWEWLEPARGEVWVLVAEADKARAARVVEEARAKISARWRKTQKE